MGPAMMETEEDADMKSAEEIESALSGFCGTGAYHRLTMFGNLVGTDGVAWLCENAGCHWLLDAIGSRQPECRKDGMLRDMQFWTLKVNADKSAVLTCERDAGDVFLAQKIEYTDFPVPEVKLWVEAGECGGKPVMVVMLPGER
jgi:hypothetical protein